MSEEVKEIVQEKQEEVKKEEQLIEELPVEDEKVNIENEVEEKEEDKENDDSEEPKNEEESTVEQLSIIKEVRSELAKSYQDMQSLAKTNEQLSAEMEELKNTLASKNKEVEQLGNMLNDFKSREEEAQKLAHVKRLEKLSANFAELGQNKTIEHLSKLDTAVISEFEEITNLALEKRQSERLNAVTVPSQSMSPKKAEPVKTEEKLNQNDFFGSLCNTLGKQQSADGGDSKRIITL
jgi:chromosome segregation ATPase